jgi:hypothetical protein
MPKFRKKPVVIEAELFDQDKQHHLSAGFRVAMCWDQHDVTANALEHGDPHIHTLEGLLWVSDGDWIIKGIKGEFYPCKPDIFEATYESVSEEVPVR